MSSRTVYAIVPAFNEEEGLGDTIESLLNQEGDAFDEIVVVNDCSTDRTKEIAESYGVTVLTPPSNLGSKAKAQNYALKVISERPTWSHPDLVLPVDADTLLAPDYVQLIKKPFDDERVVIAAGCVQTRYDNTWTEKGRMIEYLFGFHWHRPIQNMAMSPMVCSGCCSAFRFVTLIEFGSFPERTIVEDMDYTWTQQIKGARAVYVADAVAWAADPTNVTYLRKQVWRWMSGFFQNVRQHMGSMIVKKPMLALWVLLAVWDIVTVPLWWTMPFVAYFFFHNTGPSVATWFVGTELLLTLPPLIYGARKRKIGVRHMLRNWPWVYVIRLVNNWYAWKAMVVELVLVPLGLSEGLHDYEKGRADTPEAEGAPVPVQAARGRHRAVKPKEHFVPLAELMERA